jgi:hypothetical protein
MNRIDIFNALWLASDAVMGPQDCWITQRESDPSMGYISWRRKKSWHRKNKARKAGCYVFNDASKDERKKRYVEMISNIILNPPSLKWNVQTPVFTNSLWNAEVAKWDLMIKSGNSTTHFTRVKVPFNAVTRRHGTALRLKRGQNVYINSLNEVIVGWNNTTDPPQDADGIALVREFTPRARAGSTERGTRPPRAPRARAEAICGTRVPPRSPRRGRCRGSGDRRSGMASSTT